ncbi:MAG: polysaccharide lyase [Pseudobdellovibrionaceae bacterium]
MVYIFLFLFLLVGAKSYAQILFEDNFEKKEDSNIFARFSHLKDLVEIAPGAGVNGSAGFKITYKGNNEGSRRLVAKFKLSKAVTEASLSYDVKFDEDFQFVKGGKLHGLGPIHPITGGQPMKESGWSSRVMFEESGAVATYLYHQNKSCEYGETRIGKDFQFEKGKFYALTLYTKLNSAPFQTDGEARIYINGKLITEQKNILFWKSNAEESKIFNFLFSTFHGGHDTTWAPKNKDGRFTEVHAIFDNFVVEEGFKVRKVSGQNSAPIAKVYKRSGIQ